MLLPKTKTAALRRMWPGFVNSWALDGFLLNLLEKLPESAGLFDCWEWQGAKRGGYAVYGDGKRTGTSQTSRIVWMLVYGKVLPRSLDVDHLCHNPPCVNPLHLEAVPHKVNIDRRKPKQPKTHCPKGHEKFVKSDGRRECRVCIAAATRAWLDKGDNRERQNAMRSARR